LINPGTATGCDCGWSFVDEAMTAVPLAARRPADDDERKQGASGAYQVGIGMLLLLTGIVITAVTYGGASASGGTYIIAYGPIVFGIINIIRGIARSQ
jgi:hypothetical protein